MSILSFQIPLEPISLNTSHRNIVRGKRFMRIKTEKTSLWEREFQQYLGMISNYRDDFLKEYDPKRKAIQIDIFFYLNKSVYFTKSGTISKTGKDLDNLIKVGNDQVFKWLGIDDSQVIKLSAEKIPTVNEPSIFYQISLISYPATFSGQVL